MGSCRPPQWLAHPWTTSTPWIFFHSVLRTKAVGIALAPSFDKYNDPSLAVPESWQSWDGERCCFGLEVLLAVAGGEFEQHS